MAKNGSFPTGNTGRGNNNNNNSGGGGVASGQTAFGPGNNGFSAGTYQGTTVDITGTYTGNISVDPSSTGFNTGSTGTVTGGNAQAAITIVVSSDRPRTASCRAPSRSPTPARTTLAASSAAAISPWCSTATTLTRRHRTGIGDGVIVGSGATADGTTLSGNLIDRSGGQTLLGTFTAARTAAGPGIGGSNWNRCGFDQQWRGRHGHGHGHRQRHRNRNRNHRDGHHRHYRHRHRHYRHRHYRHRHYRDRHYRDRHYRDGHYRDRH